jgi:hypothetical protein
MEESEKAQEPEFIGTDVMTKMVVAITNGVPKVSMDLTPAQSMMWDRLAEEIARCPPGHYVDPGDGL